jgi:hypothetical protein
MVILIFHKWDYGCLTVIRLTYSEYTRFEWGFNPLSSLPRSFVLSLRPSRIWKTALKYALHKLFITVLSFDGLYPVKFQKRNDVIHEERRKESKSEREREREKKETNEREKLFSSELWWYWCIDGGVSANVQTVEQLLLVMWMFGSNKWRGDLFGPY